MIDTIVNSKLCCVTDTINTACGEILNLNVTSLPTPSVNIWIDIILPLFAAVVPLIAVFIGLWQIRKQLENDRHLRHIETEEKAKEYFLSAALQKRDEVIKDFCRLAMKKSILPQDVIDFQNLCLCNYVYLNESMKTVNAQMVDVLQNSVTSGGCVDVKIASQLLSEFTFAWENDYQGDKS